MELSKLIVSMAGLMSITSHESYDAEKLNELIELIIGEGDEKISDNIKTGLYDGHTLSELFEDIKNGNLSSYLDVYGKSLLERIEKLISDIGAVKRDMGVDYTAPEFVILDCGHPENRMEGGYPDAE